MSNVLTFEDQIRESKRTRVWGEFPQDWVPSTSEREQVIIPLDSLSEIQQQKGTITVDIPPITWELIPPKDPFSISSEDFFSLEDDPDKATELLSRAGDLCKDLLEDAWKKGIQQAVICDGTIIFESREIDGISNEKVEQLIKEYGKACYVFSAPDIIEESVWTPITSDDSYPTLCIYLGTEESDKKDIVKNNPPIYADLDTGNPSLKIFDANQLVESLRKFKPYHMREAKHFDQRYIYFRKKVKMCVMDINSKINSIAYDDVRVVRNWQGCAVLQVSPNRTGFVGRDVLRDLRIRIKLDPIEKTTQILDVSS